VAKGQKMGRVTMIQTWVVYFQRYHRLSVSVYSVDTCGKSRLLTTKTNVAT